MQELRYIVSWVDRLYDEKVSQDIHSYLQVISNGGRR